MKHNNGLYDIAESLHVTAQTGYIDETSLGFLYKDINMLLRKAKKIEELKSLIEKERPKNEIKEKLKEI